MRVLQKAWKLMFCNYDIVYPAETPTVYASCKRKAIRAMIEELERNYELDEDCLELVPDDVIVRRDFTNDIIRYGGSKMARCEKVATILERNRRKVLNEMMEDDSFEYCYIVKRGQFYCDNFCGYTEHAQRAGVYKKKVAIQHVLCCDGVKIVPINIEEHNELIRKEIEFLKRHLIEEE